MVFKDKIIWITGASSGIGEALAHAFEKKGARLILSARREAELIRVQSSLNGQAKILALDVSDIDSLPEKTDQAIACFGHIDILINNAGISQRGRVEDSSIEVDKRIFDVNFFGNIALTKAILPHLLHRKTGHIVPVSSVTGKLSTPGRSSYAASKHALHGWYDALRAEVVDRNIYVTLVCPGYVKTQVSINALNARGEKHGIMDPNQESGMDAGECAEQILRAISKNRKESYIGKEKYFVVLRRFFPAIYYRIIEKMAANQTY